MKVAGRVFQAEVPAERCTRCGELYFRGPSVERWERAIARDLMTCGPVSAEGLSYSRRAVGMEAVRLAELLDVRPETVSRWENGRRPIDRATWLAAGTLILEELAEEHEALDRVRALAKPPRKVTRLNIAA
jgi:hypothetical protein